MNYVLNININLDELFGNELVQVKKFYDNFRNENCWAPNKVLLLLISWEKT